MVEKIPVRSIRWKSCYRLIYTRADSIHLFERISDEMDWDIIRNISDLYNPRIRAAAGDLPCVAQNEHVGGPRSAYIMAPFAYPNLSRFSDGKCGVFYGAQSEATAIAEVRHHTTIFMQSTPQEPTLLEMQLIGFELQGRLHDIRGMINKLRDVYNPHDYTTSNRLASELRLTGSWGIVYDSVRHDGGHCAAVFRPPVLRNPQQQKYIFFQWDGNCVSNVLGKNPYA